MWYYIYVAYLTQQRHDLVLIFTLTEKRRIKITIQFPMNESLIELLLHCTRTHTQSRGTFKAAI